jgi:hypothetical protein
MVKLKKLLSAIKEAIGSEKHILMVGLDSSGKSIKLVLICERLTF